MSHNPKVSPKRQKVLNFHGVYVRNCYNNEHDIDVFIFASVG